MNQHQQKVVSTLIVTIGAFLGFEALSYVVGLYQLKNALFLSFYIYAFHIFWLMFVFDLHLKKRPVLAELRMNYKGLRLVGQALKERFGYMVNWAHYRHFQNHLVLPGLLYWSVVILIYLNPFNYFLKQTIIFSAVLAMNVGYWYLKEHVSRRLEAHNYWIKMLALVKLYCAFLVYSALVGVSVHFGYGPSFLVLGTSTLTFLLVYQMLFQHELLTFTTLMWVVTISLLMALISVGVYTYWNTEYFTAGLVMLSIYNTLWGLLHHGIEKNLTKRIAWEYLLMTLFIISFLFASHNFNQRII